jgi:hypothetical protein
LTLQQYDCVHGLVGHTVFSARRVPAPHKLAEQTGFAEQHSSCVHCGPAQACTKPLREKPLPQSPALHTGLVIQHSSASSHLLFSVQHSATVHNEPAHRSALALREKNVAQSRGWPGSPGAQ